MAVRVYRAPVGIAPAPQNNANVAARPARAKTSGRSAHVADAIDAFDDSHHDSHIAERHAQKENRAGRREFEAARKAKQQMREDRDHDIDD